MFVLPVLFVLPPLVVVLVSVFISFRVILGGFLVVLIACKLFRSVVLSLVVLLSSVALMGIVLMGIVVLIDRLCLCIDIV